MQQHDLALQYHYDLHGKIEMVSRVGELTRESLALCYTPGVASPCLTIQKHPKESFELTRRWNTVAVISDGSAVLGLGNIGALAAMPVMEGKAVLFRTCAGIDAIPLVIDSQNVDLLVQTIALLAPSFGGINLEDISAPRCFEVERRLQQMLPIPVFHDDQHGTAIVVLAAAMNALKIVGKKPQDIQVVICGAGAAGTAIFELLHCYGMRNIIVADQYGILCNDDNLDSAKRDLANKSNPNKIKGSLIHATKGADLLIGVSAGGAFSQEMIGQMNTNAIVFALANPTPEIFPNLAKAAGARIVGTGRSDFNNQINNVLAFPGIFRGALDARATHISTNMQLAAAHAIAALVKEDELNEDNILPQPLDPRVAVAVAQQVKMEVQKNGR